jgi:hypothetical protein
MAKHKYIYTETLYIQVEVYAEDAVDATDTAGGFIGRILGHEDAERHGSPDVRAVSFESANVRSDTEDDFYKNI